MPVVNEENIGGGAVPETDPLAIKLADLIQTVQNDSAKVASSAAVFAELANKATPAQITAAIDNLINSAPGALDTLNELAAALGDDANFASTITTALAGKEPNITKLSGFNLALATLAEAQAGSANDKVMTPLRVANAIANAGKQETLVSGTNIKSINGSSILGAGDLIVGSAINFTYGETISAGNLVELRSDGKVYKINSTAGGAYQNTPYDSNSNTAQSGIFVDNINNKIIVIGCNSSGNMSIRCGSVSGTAITWGTAVQLFAQTFPTGIPSITYNASSGSYVCAYGDGANSNFLTFRAFTVSGNTITLGTAVVVSSANSYVKLQNTSASMVVATYKAAGNCFVVTISISGTTLTVNTAVDTAQGTAPEDCIYVDSQNRLYLAWNGGTFRTYTRSSTTLTLEINNSTIYTGTLTSFMYSSTLGKVVCSINTTQTMTFYTVDIVTTASANDSIIFKRISSIATYSSHPTVLTASDIICSVHKTSQVTGSIHIKGLSFKDGLSKEYAISANLNLSINNLWSVTGDLAFVWGNYTIGGSSTSKVSVIALSNLFNYIGIANASGVLNESKEVKISGTVYTTTGLTAGANYYVQLDGTYSTAPTGLYLGRAISTTQLLLDI